MQVKSPLPPRTKVKDIRENTMFFFLKEATVAILRRDHQSKTVNGI